ncbi:hypothetical protein [Primorskyibacter sp. S187A]|uniref:hypothetical protein n=1 Tax=Primorskyibacter sp. S187A TaxID=3415130 RepID=UPI003C7D6455
MKLLATALMTALVLAGPAAAFGPTMTLPVLEFPQDTGTLSTQGCSEVVKACK